MVSKTSSLSCELAFCAFIFADECTYYTGPLERSPNTNMEPTYTKNKDQ